MTESTIKPDEIYIDKINHGKARLLCRWNIAQIIRTDDVGEHILWQYDEVVMWWTFPMSDGESRLDDRESIAKYIAANSDEIMNFAKGSTVTL